MPRVLIPLGLAALLVLGAVVLLTTDGREQEEIDGTREESWRPATPSERGEERPQGAPTLKGSGTAPGHGETEGGATEPEAKEPTGPYEFVVVAFESEALLEDVEITDDEGEPLGTTDEDGAFVLEDAGVSDLVFRATKDGYVTHRAHAQPGEVTQVVLQAGIQIRGRVVRAAGSAPIADASVIVWDDDFGREVAATSTNEEGRFVLRAVRPNHPVQIVVRTEGLVPHLQREMFHVSLEDFEIRVGDGGRLRGAVTTPEEKPLPGVEVRLQYGGETIFEHRAVETDRQRARARLTSMRTAVTRTNEQGLYEFLGVPLNQYVQPVAIVAPRFVVKAPSPSGCRFRDYDETQRRDIVVGAPASLRIRIEDAKGAAIGHADVHLRAGQGYWPLLPADTHEQGGYLLQDLAPQHVYATATLPGAPMQAGDVKLEAGKESTILITFPLGAALRGTVHDKRGQPIWKALVNWAGKDKGEQAATRTDQKGRFELSRLESKTGTIYVSARDLPYTLRTYEGQEIENTSPGALPLEVRLLDGTRAKGRFEDVPQGAVVTSTLARGSRHDRLDHHLKQDGRFTRRGPPVDKPALFVFRMRGFPPLLVEEPRPFTSEEVRDLGPLRFEATNPRMGRIVDGRKLPVHGALVTIKTPWSSRTTRTDIEGDFALPRLPDEDIPLEIRAEGFPATRAILWTSSQFRRQTIFIRRTGPLFVDVTRKRGRLDRPVTVLAKARGWKPGDARPKETYARTHHSGRARFHLPPGRYQLIVFDQITREVGVTEVEIKAKPSHHARIELRPQRRRR